MIDDKPDRPIESPRGSRRWLAYLEAGGDQSPLGRNRRWLHYMLEVHLSAVDKRLKDERGELDWREMVAPRAARRMLPKYLEAVENALVGETESDRNKDPNEKIDDLIRLVDCLLNTAALYPWPSVAVSDGKRIQAQIARERLAISRNAEEKALISAIMAELRGCPVTQPYKQADAMLIEVNRRLSESGHDSVKVDVVRRRLKKIAALLKSAEADSGALEERGD